MNLRETLKIEDGVLVIGGVSTTDLVKKYGSPLYVMDVAYIRQVIRAFRNTLINNYGEANMAFASKAFSCMAMYSIVKSENSCIDVVSEGEIYTAMKAGFDLSNAYFHGNNKLPRELQLAIENNIGIVVIDSMDEIALLDEICREYGKVQKVHIRTNPGVEAHTHSYIQTAKIDSKFGFSIGNGDATNAIKAILNCKNLVFNGLNCHIGSQIFDTNAFRLATDVMTDYMVFLRDNLGLEIKELNMGGGFGIHYTESDPKYNVEEYCNYVNIIIEELNSCLELKSLVKPRLVIEPGRAIVGEAGITLYSVGNIKNIPNVKKYVCIDGGMFDNIRPALYQAEYEAIVANKAAASLIQEVAIAGKCCESADIIISKVNLPDVVRGDIIAVFSTGAYNYSMASNYNRNPVPPVVMVEDGKSAYAVKPQSIDDIVRNDTIPEFLK